MDPTKSPLPFKEGSIHLWIADLQTWKKHTGNLESLLSADELKRLKRLKVHDKQEEFLFSRGILRIILSKYLTQDPGVLAINLTPTGKPFLPESEIRFNISHSGNLFICGICINNQIGLDIQEIYPISNIDRIINNYFSPTEIQHLRKLPSRELYRKHFFAIWAAKEAYLKAVGDGIRESFNQISVIPQSPDLMTFQLDLPVLNENELNWTINSLDLGQGFHSAIALDGPIQNLNRFEFDPDDYFTA